MAFRAKASGAADRTAFEYMATGLLLFSIGALSALLGLNIVASRLVLISNLDSRGSKLAQLAVIWLLPMIGAVVVLIVKRGQPEASSRGYPEPREPIEDVALSRRDYDND